MAEGKDAGSRVTSRLSGKSSDADTDLAEHVSLRAADLTAHRRLVSGTEIEKLSCSMPQEAPPLPMTPREADLLERHEDAAPARGQ